MSAAKGSATKTVDDARGGQSDAKVLDALVGQGAVCIIDLCSFKAAAGQLWDSVAASASARLEALLNQNLGPSASFVRLDATRYAVSLPSSGLEDAMIVALSVTYKFFMAMQCRCELDDLRISRVEPGVGGAPQVYPVRGETIADLQEKAELNKLVLPTYFRRKQVLDAPAATSLKESVPDHFNKKTFPRNLDLKVKHRFEPVWHAQRQAITTYICTPVVSAIVDGAEAQLPLEALDFQKRIAIEESSLEVGLRYLSEYIEKADRFMLGVPISFDVLSSPMGRMKFASICRCLPSIYRQYLAFFITKMPLGIAQSRLSEFVSLLRPFGRVIATVAPGGRNFHAYQGIGLSGIALDLHGASMPIERVKSDIVHLGAAGRYSKLTTMIYGATDAAVLQQAYAADIQLLHGEAMGMSLDAPRRMTHLPSSSVLPASVGAGDEEWF